MILELNETEKRINELLDDMFFDSEIDTTKEIELNELMSKQSTLIEYYASVCCEKKLVLDARKELEKKAKKAKESAQNQLDFMKRVTIEKMKLIGQTKLKIDSFSLSVGSRDVLIVDDDIDFIPNKFLTVIPEKKNANKVEIKKAIKQGESITFARIEKGAQFLTIR